MLIYADITERKRNEAEIRAARDAAEEASRTIEAAYRDLKAAQANLIQAEKMASLGQLTAGIAPVDHLRYCDEAAWRDDHGRQRGRCVHRIRCHPATSDVRE